MTTTQLYGESQAAAALALVGGNVLGTLRNDLLKQAIVAAANKTGGGGGTGNVVGPASSTDGAVVLWDGLTGKLLKDSSILITGGGTVALGGFTLTVPATGTAALLGIAQTFTAANIFSANGVASTPALFLTGAILTGQTGATNFPHIYIQPTGATAATTLSTAGTALGMNMPSGFTGDYLRIFNNGTQALRIACGNFNVPTFYGDGTFGLIYFNANTQFNNVNVSVLGGSLNLGNSGNTSGARLDGQDAAGLISIKSGLGACELDICGSFTDNSNYERLVLRTAAGAYSIKPEAAGTGTLRTLQISGLPTSNPGPGILWNNLGIVNVGT